MITKRKNGDTNKRPIVLEQKTDEEEKEERSEAKKGINTYYYETDVEYGISTEEQEVLASIEDSNQRKVEINLKHYLFEAVVSFLTTNTSRHLK